MEHSYFYAMCLFPFIKTLEYIHSIIVNSKLLEPVAYFAEFV